MTNKNKAQFLKKKLPLHIRLATSLSLLGVMGAAFPATAQNTAATNDVEEILVSGQRGSIQSAQFLKQNSEQIVDSIVSDDIGKLPDRSITEAIQRIPGVTIERFISIGDPEHFSAEGSGVAIRGMKHVRSELNGRDSFSASGGRSLSFEDVPAELMAGVDVYKNPSADMIEGGLGGTVNLRTKMPFDTDGQHIAVSASANYGDFAEETRPSFSVLYSNRWDTDAGEFGVLLDIASSEIATRTDGIFIRPFFGRTDITPGEVTWVPRGADWRTMNFERERLGSYGAFQWRPNDETEVYFTVFRSEYDMNWDEDAIFVSNDPWSTNPSSDAVYDENNVFVSGRFTNSAPPDWAPQVPGIPFGADTRITTRKSITTDYSGGIRWLPSDAWEVSTDLQYTESSTEALDNTVATGINLNYIDVDLSGRLPSITADVNYLADPTNYYWGFAQPHVEDSDAEQLAWRADVQYNFESSPVKSIKFGVRLTDREANNIDTSYHWQGIFQTWMTTAWDGALNVDEFGMPYMQDGSQMRLNTFSNFFRGDANLQGVVWAPSLDIAQGYPDSIVKLYADAAAYADSLGHGRTDEDGNFIPFSDFYPYELRDKNDPQWLNVQKEKTYSAYALMRFGFDDLAVPVDGNIGVRVVQTESTSNGSLVYPNTVPQAPFGNGQSESLSVDNDYTNVLPSLNLRFKLSEELIARLAISKAIARPEFNQMQAYRVLDANLDQTSGSWNLTAGSWNNPNLKPLEANQFDLSLEWYFNDAGGMAHLNLFHKSIEGIIRNQTVVEQYPDLNGTLQDYQVTQPVNAGTADINGFEIGYSQFFDQLPAPFDGLGLQFNYTYIDSSTDIPVSDDPDNPGQAIAPLDTDGRDYLGELPYEGLSEHAYNIIGMYEKGSLSIRLAWSWRDEYLMSIGPNGFNGTDGGLGASEGARWKLPVYSDASGQLDGSIFYRINDNLQVGLEMNNLTNEETRTIMKQNSDGAGDHYASYFVNDTRYALTLRANF